MSVNLESENSGSKQETREFQAEVKQLLDIVINSLYTDREIFLRELISNAADALEKFRYENIINKDVSDPDLPLHISIELDEKEKLLIISDTGIGMTGDELIENLGTIAHSGSKAFIKSMADNDKKDLNLIGQFGVGFYAAFMVARKVTVLTKSYQPEAQAYEWSSEGMGSYAVKTAGGITRGTRIILELKEDALDFIKPETVKRIIKQYSSFVAFPIFIGEEKVNTVEAIWTKNKNEIKDDEYNEFYKFIGNAYDEPFYRLHFNADAPLTINAILFVPKNNLEQVGFGNLEPGVNLYCRKVLIQQHSEGILPEWLRFVKGVVDSEEIPLNISRETMQDSALMAKLRKVLTGRFLKFLAEQAKSDPEKYSEFYKEFSRFLKEGATSDIVHRKDIVKLLRFESSKTEDGKYTSFEDYLSRMKEEQKYIYYINGPSREFIEAGPYLEMFKAKDIEVIYTHEAVDDFIMTHVGEFEGKKLISADQSELELPETEAELETGEDALDSDTIKALSEWLKQALGDKVSEVRESKRLVDSPAVLLNMDEFMTSSMQRVMQAVHKDYMHMGKKALEINPGHELIKRLSALREKDEEFARLAAEQIYDNALVSSGLFVDPRLMVSRMYRILERALQQ
ncbi:heat shock protein Hsp90 [Desulfofarcimen acetoxidans DSM 771]|jgi:molecular chaperone HtpG|uniref:Chaperone protein HtpG n=1 Tax=Desulfofarcimen acetoxidans (strain ATCC 49208 / DSM 771 / KCTC 5769 / VKM B-1644 / 5575) TaxID=485916 RepID=C8W0D2_DESAS|nr:molecular chaperone HtpG [Desulfofarcimen acetoxidans]ACV63187.1 heat shock protein Hsp90 [Desulfofarcimen acetoxidans DSM 771]